MGIERFRCNCCHKPMKEIKPIVYMKFAGFSLGRIQTYKCSKCGITIKEIFQDYTNEQMKQMVKDFNDTVSLELVDFSNEESTSHSLNKTGEEHGR